MQRIFRTRTFSRWMRKSGVSDSDLTRAVEEMMQGLVDADLGGHLFKKRVAVPVGENVAAQGRFSQQGWKVSGSFFSVF